MRAAWRITRKDLLLRLRDRSAFIVGTLIPLALAFIFNAVFGGAVSGEGSLTTIGFVDEDGGQVTAGLGDALAALDEEGTILVETLATEEELRSRVADGDLSAGIAVPSGFSSAALAGERSTVEVVGDVDSPASLAIARGIAQSFAAAVEDAQRAAEVVATGDAGHDPAVIQRLAQAAATAGPLVTVGPVAAADRVLEPATFFAAGMGVFFLFFLVQFGVTGLIDEEREGTLTRLQAAPIPRSSIVVGKGLTSFLLGILALTILALATTLLMGADWGDPLGLAALFVAVTLAATSLVGIVGALAKTAEGAGNLVAVIAVGMGMLGGTFFPVGANNRALELASQATPHFWFLRGIGDLQTGGSVSAAASSLLALGIFALVSGSVAAVLLARRYR